MGKRAPTSKRQTAIKPSGPPRRQRGYPPHSCGAPMLPICMLGAIGQTAPRMTRPLFCTKCYTWYSASAAEKRKADRAADADLEGKATVAE